MQVVDVANRIRERSARKHGAVDIDTQMIATGDAARLLARGLRRYRAVHRILDADRRLAVVLHGPLREGPSFVAGERDELGATAERQHLADVKVQ